MSHNAHPVQVIHIRRAYVPASADDGFRVLVDRVWPRGKSKATLALGEWAGDLAPSTALRQWFGHLPERWELFQTRYRAELATDAQQARLRALLVAAGGRPITLVYGAKDEQHNQAIVLQEVLLALCRA